MNQHPPASARTRSATGAHATAPTGCARLDDAPGLARPAWRALFMGLITLGLGACQSAPPSSGVQACPMPVARWVQCPHGQRISAYEPAPDLESYCSALADPARMLRAVRPGSPVYELPGGYRTLLTGSSGWLVFPPDKGPLDVGPGIARWWREAGCAPI